MIDGPLVYCRCWLGSFGLGLGDSSVVEGYLLSVVVVVLAAEVRSGRWDGDGFTVAGE